MRGLAHRLREPLETAERGHLLETLVLHELRAYQNVSNCGGNLAYWRTPYGSEVDLVWTRGKESVAIEVKASTRWRNEFSHGLKAVGGAGVASRCISLH
ncbi:MAG: DUF4143 domain-containing protein [Myxococcaceae bacterium]